MRGQGDPLDLKHRQVLKGQGVLWVPVALAGQDPLWIQTDHDIQECHRHLLAPKDLSHRAVLSVQEAQMAPGDPVSHVALGTRYLL